jgi:hypothetical protein
VDDARASPTCPQENKNRRSGQFTRYQNRTTSFAIDINCRPTENDNQTI